MLRDFSLQSAVSCILCVDVWLILLFLILNLCGDSKWFSHVSIN